MREMELGEFCDEFLLDEKLFIVPTRSIGLLMINSMARDAKAALNLNPITLRRLSQEICQRYIETNNILFIDDILGKSIVLDCLKSLELEDEDFFFKSNLIDEKTAEEVYRVLMELKSKKIEEFPEEKDIDKIYSLYRKKLRDLNAMDYCDILVKALELEELKIFQDKKIGLAGNIEFHNLERDLFSALGQEIIKIKMPVENLADSPKDYFFKEVKELKDQKREISFFTSYGMRNEIKYIIDDILEKKIPLDQVVIAYTDSKYVEAIDLEFKKEDLAVSFGEGLEITSSTSYRFIKTLFEFSKNYYSVQEIGPLFFNGSLNVESLEARDKDKEDPISSSIMYEELLRAKVFYGRESYEKLNTIPEDLKEEENFRREWLKEFFQDLLSSLPQGEVNFKLYSKRLSSLLEKYVKTPNPYHEKSKEAILDRLSKIGKIPLRVSKEEYFDMVLAYIEEVNIKRSGARPSEVFACKYSNAGYTARRHLYLIGLDSHSLASKIVESPILLDNTRRDISLSLSFSKESYRYKNYKIKEALSASFERISVGYSNFDMVEVKAKTPSKIYTELKEEYGHSEHEDLEPLESRSRRLMAKDLVFSGTDLEVLGQCSRKLYLKNSLVLKEKEDIVMDIDRWLDPLTRGNLVHNVLNQYFDLPRSQQREGELLSIIDRLAKEIEREIPYVLEEVYRREKEEVRDYCLKIIEREKRSSLQVFINELSFGRGKENQIFGNLDPQIIDIGDLSLRISGAIDRVDIDREEKKFKIIDYKTGSLRNFDKRLRKTQGRGKNKVIDYSEGQKFQFFIYKKALENIIKTQEEYKDFRVESFSYEFKDDSIDLEFEKDFLELIEARIKDLLEIDILEEDKTIIYDEKDDLSCKYCEYKNICKTDNIVGLEEEV